jgi:hypothetical protein
MLEAEEPAAAAAAAATAAAPAAASMVGPAEVGAGMGPAVPLSAPWECPFAGAAADPLVDGMGPPDLMKEILEGLFCDDEGVAALDIEMM